MTIQQISNPYRVFSDARGELLESGYIYIGKEGLNPELNPVQVYIDSDFSTPIDQPIRTLAGVAVDGSSPVNLYMNGDSYSITIKNKKQELIYSNLDVFVLSDVFPNLKISGNLVFHQESDFSTLTSLDGILTLEDIERVYNANSRVRVEVKSNESDNMGGIFKILSSTEKNDSHVYNGNEGSLCFQLGDLNYWACKEFEFSQCLNKQPIAQALEATYQNQFDHSHKEHPTIFVADRDPKDSAKHLDLALNTTTNQVRIATQKPYGGWLNLSQSLGFRYFTIFDESYFSFPFYTGNITFTVYPFSGGNTGLPTSSLLANQEWHTITESVSSLTELGRVGADYFNGIIGSVYFETGNKFVEIDSKTTYLPEIDAQLNINLGNTLGNINKFIIKFHEYNNEWVSENIIRKITPNITGSTITQLDNVFTATNTTGSDEVRFLDSFWSIPAEMALYTSNVSGEGFSFDVDGTEKNRVYNNKGSLISVSDANNLVIKRTFGTSSGTITVNRLNIKIDKQVI